MFVALGVVNFILILLCLKKRFSSLLEDRAAFLFSAILLGSLVVISTEILSAFGVLTLSYVAGFHVLVFITALTVLINLKQKLAIHFPIREILSGWNSVFIFPILITVLAVGLAAIMCPPNTWDSLTYHMSRVAHWAQNRTVANYPASALRQLLYAPGAEYFILQLQILASSDRFANCVQWFSLIGSILGVSLIAKQLGAKGRGQIVASFFAATIPMGILQGSSTQNDYAVTFWLVCFVYFLFGLKERLNWLYVGAVAFSLGLAVLTKPTAYIIAFPFLVWFVMAVSPKYQWKIIPVFSSLGLGMLGINLGFWIRSHELLRIFSTPPERIAFAFTVNQTWSLQAFCSNVVRNIGLHLGTSSRALNAFLEKGIYQLHDWLHLSITDSRTTFGGLPFNISVNTHEDFAGNFCQLALILGCIVLWSLSRQMRQDKLSKNYLLISLSTFFLFCLVLKWQPYHSRLHLPIFVLFAPFVGVVLERSLGKRMGVLLLIGGILFATSIPYSFRNSRRKLISSKKTVFSMPRKVQYFLDDQKNYFEPYTQAVDLVCAKGCHQVGLWVGWNEWEYPFWALFEEKHLPDLRMEQVKVPLLNDLSYPLGVFEPCAVIARDCSSETIAIGNKKYIRNWQNGPVCVFLKE